MSGPLKPPRALRPHARLASHALDGLRLAAADRRLLAAIRDHSPYLTTLLEEDVGRAQKLFDLGPQAMLDDAVDGLAEARFADEAAAMQALRRAKRASALAIAFADLSGVFDVAAATEALTRFADAAVRAALRFVLSEAARDGRLAAGRERRRTRLRVRRAGARQARRRANSTTPAISTSSLFYDPDSAARFPKAPRPGRCSCGSPSGSRGCWRSAPPTAMCCASICGCALIPARRRSPCRCRARPLYYETLGQNWERAAMIKARADRRRSRARRGVSDRARAVHLAQIFRLRGDRRHSRDEAADPRGARA